jgi:hypothetical protein
LVPKDVSDALLFQIPDDLIELLRRVVAVEQDAETRRIAEVRQVVKGGIVRVYEYRLASVDGSA